MHFIRKLFYSAVIGVTIVLASCKAKEDIKLDERVLFPVPISTATEQETEIASKRQSFLEKIVKENELKYVADIIFFCEPNKERYEQVMKKEYALDMKTSELWNGIKARESNYASITIIPRELISKDKRSVLIVFSSAFEKAKKEEDTLSFIVDHEYTHALDNAKGIILCGEKILHEQILKMGPLRYQDILELRAYGNQLNQILAGKRDVSDECKALLIAAYAIIHSRVIAHALQGNKYALSAIEQAEYLPVLDVGTKNLILMKKEPVGEEKPK